MILIGGDFEAWGFIPGFLDERDPRPAREQFHERYMGGWVPAPPGLTFDPVALTLTYPDDPVLRPISGLQFRDETLLLYPSSWVVIIQRDGSWAAARMD